MNPYLQQIIVNSANKKSVSKPKNTYSKSDFDEAYKKFKIKLRHEFINYLLLSLGIVSAGFGLKGFLLPNSFIDGGITGISLLLSIKGHFSLPILIVLLNIPFLFIGLKQLGLGFVLKTMFGILGFSVCLAFITYPVVTSDKLLVAVFGGIFLGTGIGLAVRGGGVLDGTEIMAIYINKNSALTIGDIILVFNVLIFSVAAWLLSIETALYSILAYIIASKAVDFVLVGIEEFNGVTIISEKNFEIRKMITNDLGRGVTIYKGSKAYGKTGHQQTEIDVLFSVITRLEVAKLYTEIEKIDPQAFIVMNSIKDTKGGMIKKRITH